MRTLVTASEANFSREKQVEIILRAIESKGGSAQMVDLYIAVEEELPPNMSLSDQGKASLREVVNRYCVRRGYLYPHDRNNPGWRITSEGRDALSKM